MVRASAGCRGGVGRRSAVVGWAGGRPACWDKRAPLRVPGLPGCKEALFDFWPELSRFIPGKRPIVWLPNIKSF